jgi:peptidoglycan/LPS O-acetylase OafA/YrhL
MTAQPAAKRDERRGDLDALRGVAMILGIVLHASLAYFPFPWPVQDSRQQSTLALVFAAIHGFRMPMFFLLSGFFTMLVFQRRGLRGLLAQRALRIALPLAVGMLTIVPLNRAVISRAIQRGVAATAARSPLVGSILTGDAAAVRQTLATVGDPSARDPMSGLTPLALAAMRGDTGIVKEVLDAGAAIDASNRDGSTPLHAAAFMGEPDVVELLLAGGANPAARNSGGKTPLDALGASVDYAIAVRKFLGLSPRNDLDVMTDRLRARDLLAACTPASAAPPPLNSIADAYQAALASPRFLVDVGGTSWHLFANDVFGHLWFLWYLCWMVAAFALAHVVGLTPTGRGRWWLVPASCLPSALMSSPFGPDVALGLLPAPHLFLFYGCFFWFGASTFAAEGTATPLGRQWRVVLPLSMLVLFPVAIAAIGQLPLAATLQPAYAWGMSLGFIGLFHQCFARSSAAIRWLSDAAYWMYLAHLPLVIACQSLLLDASWPAIAKFLVVIAVNVAILLVTYRWCVRYTPIGWLLNGPRSRAADVAAA